MKLEIVYAKNRKIINADENMLVAELKRGIAQLFQINANNMILKYASVLMVDEKPILRYGLTENSVIEVLNRKIDLKVISDTSEVLLKNLDMNMKIEDLKKRYSQQDWNNLTFYYRYEYSEFNDKKIVDLKILNEKIDGKEDVLKMKKTEIKDRYYSEYGGDKLYWFIHEKLANDNATIAEYALNENCTIYIAFQIYVFKGGSVYTFDVFKDLSIRDLKSLIRLKIDKSILDFELTFQGEVLQDTERIKDYEMDRGCTLIMTIGTGGG